MFPPLDQISIKNIPLFIFAFYHYEMSCTTPVNQTAHTENHSFNKVVLACFMCWIFEREEVPLLTPFTQSEGPELPPIAGTDPGRRKSH